MTFDAIDRKLLNLVQRDATATTKTLAHQLGLSATAVYERLRKLQREGVITKQVALLDRLVTMAAHTDLGAGMAIAMKDLEIRGAGNLLGEEQSGHIADVGFDLYLRLVGEAVAEYRGEDTEPEPEMKIELPVEAHLPVDYVESERLRLEMYKRLAAVRSEAELDAVSDELLDRYGPLPEAAANLLEEARFRLL